MANRLRLKVGPIEVEQEGDTPPSRDELLELATAAAQLYREYGLRRSRGSGSVKAAKLQILGTTASIASRLNCISAPELIVAAAARLTFVEGQEWFERAQLLAEMKQAFAHYDESYERTLLEDVASLVASGKLVEFGENVYALSATMRRELQQALAE